jgi:hypothetical protein
MKRRHQTNDGAASPHKLNYIQNICASPHKLRGVGSMNTDLVVSYTQIILALDSA